MQLEHFEVPPLNMWHLQGPRTLLEMKPWKSNLSNIFFKTYLSSEEGLNMHATVMKASS